MCLWGFVQKKIVFGVGSVYIIGMDIFMWPGMILLIGLPWLIRRILPPVADEGATAWGGGALRVPFFTEAAMFGARVAGGVSRGMRGLLIAMWLCFVAAAMRPVIYDGGAVVPREARNIMLAVDVSESMAQQDFDMAGQPVSRLAMVRDVVGDFIRQRAGDRIGLVIFGSEAHLLAPLSRDRKALAALFADVGIGAAGGQTAIGDALAQAVRGTVAVPADKKVVILLSDGYNNAGVVSVAQAIDLARKQQIKVYTVGIGSDRQVVTDFFGVAAMPGVDLDEALLQQIATETGGRYFRAKSAADLREIYTEVDRLEALPDEADPVRPRREMFWLPLLVGMGLWAIAVGRRGGRA